MNDCLRMAHGCAAGEYSWRTREVAVAAINAGDNAAVAAAAEALATATNSTSAPKAPGSKLLNTTGAAAGEPPHACRPCGQC